MRIISHFCTFATVRHNEQGLPWRMEKAMMQTCMGCAGILLTRILWSLSVLTMYWLSGLTVRLVIMLQKWPRKSCGAWTQAAIIQHTSA